jgi:hypothetical protein
MSLHPVSGPTNAERIDQAVTAVLRDDPVAVPPQLAPELAIARALRSGLHPVPPGVEFEGELARRLEAGAADERGIGAFLRQHQRLVLTGAVGSVVVSTAGVAVVAWRLVHRQP